ncbi:MAG: hypothetical protein M1391_13540 [Bacteroidetes bacterium]|nr:hypothetical protein [Bacteroidota bacterium]
MKNRSYLIAVLILLTVSSRLLYAQTGNKPTIFEKGIISTGDFESHPTFSAHGDTLYFLKCSPDFFTYTICVSYLKNGTWTKPKVASFSGKYLDADPFLTRNGNMLFFISNRPVKKGDPVRPDFDIWKVMKTKNGWGEPIHLDEPVNSPGDEYYPTVADDGSLYFGSGRSEGNYSNSDLFRSKLENGKYLHVESLGDSVNSPLNDYEPFISPKQDMLIFMSTRPNGLRNADLYISFNKDGHWTKAQKLPAPINSGGEEFSPKITWDGKYFTFSSTRNTFSGSYKKTETMEELSRRLHSAGNGLGDIYIMDYSAFEKIIDGMKP